MAVRKRGGRGNVVEQEREGEAEESEYGERDEGGFFLLSVKRQR